MRTCLKKHGVIFSDKGKNPNSIKNLDLGKFKPGQSGNPAGRPKGYASLSERLKLLLEKSVGDIITESEKTVILKNQGKGFLELSIADAIVKTAVRESLKGDFKFIDMLWQRIDGKVAERIAGHDGGPLQTDSPAVNILAKAAGNPKLAKSIIELANACEDES
ncbi:MAG TPA: DUF5681 domain-containing protein [Phycisphaerae bacterium]|nr:DUF5681 domain-containing protein [Phycisphaerae bacterium]